MVYIKEQIALFSKKYRWFLSILNFFSNVIFTSCRNATKFVIHLFYIVKIFWLLQSFIIWRHMLWFPIMETLKLCSFRPFTDCAVGIFTSSTCYHTLSEPKSAKCHERSYISRVKLIRFVHLLFLVHINIFMDYERTTHGRF